MADQSDRTAERTPAPADPAQPPERPWRVEGGRERASEHPKTGGTSWMWWLLPAVVIAGWVTAMLLSHPASTRMTVPYSFFARQVHAGNVASVAATGSRIDGSFRHAVTYVAVGGRLHGTIFATVRPTFATDRLLQELLSDGVVIRATPVSSGSSPLFTALITILPILLIGGLVIWLLRRSAGAGGRSMLGSYGKSNAKRYDAAGQRTTFADVAGIDEATDELGEIVDFLRHPDRYRRLGGRIPRGVLLTGPPGTGKTLLARAVAGEADAPFFSISASEFVEMLVGVGASRVRDLFVHAKEEAPAIVFIDELDAIGRRRGSGGLTGSNDEREQTLNQILTEMDGFTGNEGVIVLAATNRPEILDGALLRAGRFDRRIAVNPPDLNGRIKILQVHTRAVPLAADVDLSAVAASTPGMVGADLMNLVNEAALGAARRDAPTVAGDDFAAALERIMLGAVRRIVISQDERRRTAYHESGHALLGMLQPGADPVRKVSIIPRGQALGVTFQSPESDRYGYGESYLRGRLIGLLGGRAAEQLIYGESTTGAEADLEQATALVRQMVGRWGMSPNIGLVSALPRPGEESMFGGSGLTSQRTLQTIDDEVKRLTDDCYARALEMLTEHRAQLEGLAEALLAHETLDETQAHRAAGIEQAPAVSTTPGSAEPPAGAQPAAVA